MAALLANAQSRAGHDVHMIYSIRPESPKDFLYLFDPKIKLYQVQMNSHFEKLQSIPKIRKILKSIRPNKVFLHSSFAGFLGRISALFLLKDTGFLYIPHCISFMRKDIGSIKKALFVLLEWIGSLKKSDYIACSKSEQTAIHEFIPFRICHLVENALDFASGAAITPVKERKNSIITVGQIRPQKGPYRFSEIAHLVHGTHPETTFIWVGDGDFQARRKLELSGVIVTGWRSKAEIWELLENARLYLSTSLWEGMPVSVIEANFAGLPVIASNCPGNIDVVENGKTGWLFETSEEAANLIRACLESPAYSEEISDRALSLAKKRFNLDRYLKDMDELINS